MSTAAACRVSSAVGTPAAACTAMCAAPAAAAPTTWHVPACRGLETLVLLAAWKLALPAAVFLLRGNHESATCTLMYGFKGELLAKYGKRDWRVRGRTKRWLGGVMTMGWMLRVWAHVAAADAAAET